MVLTSQRMNQLNNDIHELVRKLELYNDERDRSKSSQAADRLIHLYSLRERYVRQQLYENRFRGETQRRLNDGGAE